MRPRILVIDDSAEFLEPLIDLLVMSGYEAAGFSSFEEGLRWLHRNDVAFVVTDLGLADPDDVSDHVGRLREAARPAQVGVVSGWPLDKIKSMSDGAAFIVQKPVEPQMLLALLAEHTVVRAVPADRISVVEAWFAALTARDWDGLVALCTDDVVYHLPGNNARFSRTVRGRVEFRAFTVETFVSFPDARLRAEAIHALPASEAVVARFQSTWTGRNGRALAIQGAVVFEFRGTAIAHVGIRTDVDELASKHSG